MPQRKPERRLGPDWTQIGIGVVALAVSGDWLARPLWIAWRSGSWQATYSRLIPAIPQGRPSEVSTLTTPQEALSGINLALAVGVLIVGIALLRSAFSARRSPW